MKSTLFGAHPANIGLASQARAQYGFNMMNYRTSLLFVSAALLLTGCSTMQGLKQDVVRGYDSVTNTFAKAFDPEVEAKKALPQYDGNCPPVSVRPDLAKVTDFYNPASPSENTKISEATITGVLNTCRVENGQIVMQVDLSLSGKTGAKARVKPTDKPSFAYPYFVAVTDSKGNVVSKEIFAASLSYGANQSESVTTETVFQNMPIPDTSAGETFQVVVGFQLSQEQLAYNQTGLTPADYVQP